MLCKRPLISDSDSSGGKNRSGILHVFLFICFFILFSSLCYADSLFSILEQSTFSDEQKVLIEKIFKEAEEKGIIQVLILPRLEEGIAKKVRFNQLIDALKKEIEYLEQAMELLESMDRNLPPALETTIWLRTSILFSKKIPYLTIYAIALASSSRWEDYRDATALFLSLIKWGLPETEAVRAVELILKTKIPGHEFEGIMNIFTQGRRLYISPSEIIDRIEEVIDNSDTIESLEEQVLF